MKKKKQKRKKYDNFDEIESDEYFAYIAGYTSSGFAYGITHEELEEIEKDKGHFIESKNDKKVKDLDFPF